MISFIIPVLNEVRIADTALNRLLSQPGNFEVIVVDGGSIDGTPEVVQRYSVQLIQMPLGKQTGIGGQINCGVQQAHGDVLVFLHMDVQLPDNAVALIRSALISPAIVGGGFVPQFSRPTHQPDNIALTFVERMWQGRTRRLKWFAGDTAPFVRKANFAAVGGYPTTIFASDWDWAWALKAIGPLVAIHKTVIVDSRRHVYNGVVKTLLVTGSVELMYHMGVNRSFLHRWYRKWLPRER